MHGAAHVELIVQPDDGLERVLELLHGVARSLEVKQFTLHERAVIDALIRAHERGVHVRVMLNPHRTGGSRVNDESFAALRSHGVAVEWTSPQFVITHEKSMVFDGRRALIATFNLAKKYFGQTRDYGVLTAEPAQVEEIRRCFDADWKRAPFRAGGRTGLAWSADNSRTVMAEVIDGARHRLDVQHPKFVDATILDRVAAAQDRGVHVRLLSGGKHGISEADAPDTFSALRILRRTGVKVHRQKHLKLHAKMIVADERRALVGSMNIDRRSFDQRRELGILLEDEPTVGRLARVFEHDWQKAEPYAPPDPLDVATHDHGELPDDPEFEHE
ncbi:MAG: phospholipase D-like domain-containing protein [Thermodesulfobacteriota bacterium]